jgi:adenylyltransferase/sulfurtransferase
LRQARVLVAGVGALGNEVLKNLALLGVGSMLLIDFDCVERSNLSRTVLFQEADVGRPKVEAAARALARLNPEVSLETIQGDLFYDVGGGHYRHSHLTVGCLDNLAARSQVGLCCTLAGIPYLDGGMWSLGGEVRWFTAGKGPCFDCTLSADDWGRAEERRSCSGFRSSEGEEPEPVPTVATTASIIGGLLAQEAAKWLCGYPVTTGQALVYNGQTLTLHRAALARNPACRSGHSACGPVTELPERAAELTARELLGRARRDLEQRNRLEEEQPTAGTLSSDEALYLELGRDFLLALHCPDCGRSQAVNRVLGQVPEGEQLCPQCGSVRRPEVIRTLEASSPHADRPLASLGVPPGEVLAVWTAVGLQLYELTGDL